MSDTNTIRIYGASDDLVYIEGHNTKGDEYGCFDADVLVHIGDDDAGLLVRMTYSTVFNTGSWSALVGQVGDATDIPWPVRIVPHRLRRSYNQPGGQLYHSVEVQIDAPANVPMTVTRLDTQLGEQA